MVRIMIKGGVWKNSEDEILKAAVMKYGKNHWARVASLLSRKSAKQCKARWHEWLDPSIKKTEWTREEDEKLLHLAKLMPTQWRTIAPAVGRTASQCLERYEKLLDMAQEGESGEQSAQDIRKLRIGEIDPNPEGKPARPDPVDMDEDEKEMLSEARARLANTRGKKAKRKAREFQLENARRMATLQKLRELRAAGIHQSARAGNASGKKRKSHELDFNAEIPFERPAPIGFYDVSNEKESGTKRSLDPREKAKMLAEMNRKARSEKVDEKKLGKKAKENFDKLAKDNLPEALKKIAEANDPANARVRSTLVLPIPNVVDAELEEIARQQKSGKNFKVGDKSASTAGLLGDYKHGRPQSVAMATGATRLRTPAAPDLVMQDAKNQLSRINAQTPLMGGDNTTLNEGTGFKGSTPASHVPSTPSVLGSAVSVSGSRPQSVTSSVAGSIRNRMMTPLRDELQINDNQQELEDAYDDATVFEKEEKLRKKTELEKLHKGFKSLPKPENKYEMVVNINVDGEDEHLLKGNREKDASDLEAKRRRLAKQKEMAELKCRSLAVQRSLPRPTTVNHRIYDDDETLANKNEPIGLIQTEVLKLLDSDIRKHPMEIPKRKKQKRAENGGDWNPEQFSLAELNNARQLLNDAVMQDTQNSKTDFGKLQAVYASVVDKETNMSTKDNQELVNEYEVLYEFLKGLSKRVNKADQHAATLCKGLSKRVTTATNGVLDAFKKVDEVSIQLELFKDIHNHEVEKIQQRLQSKRKEFEMVYETEKELQKKYAQVTR
mmetsp:Transcript_27306/g.33321  ORF Transcript_27306/g.33321 Transcript_27306/m.33321 type:complete len:780 (+) Transcript_27306:197-2536(+)